MNNDNTCDKCPSEELDETKEFLMFLMQSKEVISSSSYYEEMVEDWR